MAARNMRYPLAQVTKLHLLGVVSLHSFLPKLKRSFAAQTAVSPVEGAQSPEVSCTVLPNKLMVNSLDHGGALSRVTIAFKVGSRNETERNRGIAHVVRSLVGISNQKCSGFAVIRNMQYYGMHFTCVADREITSFNIVGARTNLNCTLKYLAAAVTAPAYKLWEVRDNVQNLKYQIGELSPQTRVMDMLHSAAFRTGLGNSLFVHKDYIGTHTPSMLHQFYKDGFTSNRAVVSGYNVTFNDMLDFAKVLDLPENDPLEGNSNYFGGEIRKQKNSYFAHIAVATQGVGVKDVKEALVYSVLRYALGAPPSVSWGGTPSPLYNAVYEVSPDIGASCFSINYSDAGLFGFMISSFAEPAGKALEKAVGVLKSGNVSEADVKRGKAILKANILTSCENSENIIEDMAVQSLNGGILIPGPVLAEAVDKVTTADVVKAAQDVASKKFSLAAFGDLSKVPYLDQLV